MSETEIAKFVSSRLIIIAASIGCIGAGLYGLYRIRHLDKSPRKTIVMCLTGFPIGYGVSQIVNDQLRQQTFKRDHV